MSKQLLIDTLFFNKKNLIKEEINQSSGNMVLTGIIQRANQLNKNGRIYPKEVLKKAVDIYTEEFVKTRNAYGELDHNDSQSVELKNASHIITKLYWDNDDLIGSIELLNQPSGNIVKRLIEQNCSVGISSRAIGSVEYLREGEDKVEVSEVTIICWDIVSNPSTYGAFLKNKNNQLNESHNFLSKNNNNNKYNNLNKIIKKIICEQTGQCCLK